MAKHEIKDDANKVTITLDGDSADISAGGNGQTGNLKIKNTQNDPLVLIGHTGGGVGVGPNGLKIPIPVGGGAISLNNQVSEETIRLNGETGDLLLGGSGRDGAFVLFDSQRKETIRLDGKSGQILLKQNEVAIIILDPNYGNIRVGGRGVGGDIALYPSHAGQSGIDNDLQDYNKASIQLNGNNGRIVLRRHKQDGLFWEPEDSIVLDPESGNIRVGGPAGAAGNLALYPANASAADLQDFSRANIHLDGQKGDIFLKNADCAEEFDIAGSVDVEPGTVMVLDQTGKLQQSGEAYDKKVAGVISGAGDYRPGIVLDKQAASHQRLPLALMGKVFCKAEATHAPIAVGDLLTTSTLPGHAMKACDPLRAFGAVIGKALRPLTEGQGLIPILIALQ